MRYSTLVQEIALHSHSLGFSYPQMCPIFPDGLHIDDWESQHSRIWPWPRARIEALELVSRRTATTDGATSEEIREYGLGPTGDPRSDVLHRLTHLYKLPGPHPRCHREAQACHLVVHVGYTGTTEDLESLREVIAYSLGTSRAVTMLAPQIPTTTARQTALSHLSELVHWFNTCNTPHYSALVHEFGHALGIGGGRDGQNADETGHPQIEDAAMSYYPAPCCSPHPFDIMAIYALYQTVD